MLDRPITISLYFPPDTLRSKAHSYQTTVRELIATLVEPGDEVPAKEQAPAWGPFSYLGDRRLARECTGVCALVYDLDDPSIDWPALGERLETLGWIYAIHETWTEGCARLVLPLASDLHPDLHFELWEAARLALGVPVDAACRDLARLYFAPSRPQGRPAREGETGGRALLDPQSLGVGSARPTTGQRAPAPSTPAAREGNFRPENTPEKIFDVAEMRDTVRRVAKDPSKGVLLELLDGRLRLAPGTRESTLHPALSTLANLPKAPEWGVVAALLEPVFRAREGVEQHYDEWMRKAEYSYQRGQEFAAKQKEARAKVAEFFRDEGWKEKLDVVKGREGEPSRCRATISNVDLILENDERFAGKVRFNDLKRRIEIDAPSFEEESTLGTALNVWLARSEYKLEIDRSAAGAAALFVAQKHRYDPVQEYLASLPPWDGVERCKRALTDYAEAVGNKKFIENITEKFLISAVARAKEPGCQVDTALVLQGPQGGGKTSWVRVMGAGFSVETKLNVESKDAVMVATGNWLVELSEMASIKGAEMESVRSFLTQRVDQLRLPYAAAISEHPRRCVFIGTTNALHPLSDREGNRRWWVVTVGRVDTLALRRDRDQLWAEALYRYEQGQRWHLEGDEVQVAADEAAQFVSDDPVENQVLQWLESDKKKPLMTTSQIACAALFIPNVSLTDHILHQVGRALKRAEVPMVRNRVKGKMTTFYKFDPET